MDLYRGDARLRDSDRDDGIEAVEPLPKHVALLIAVCLSLGLWAIIWDILKYISMSLLP